LRESTPRDTRAMSGSAETSACPVTLTVRGLGSSAIAVMLKVDTTTKAVSQAGFDNIPGSSGRQKTHAAQCIRSVRHSTPDGVFD
jgi:hypothetical protein